MKEFGHQAVVWQTAVMPTVAIECLANGTWTGAGVVGPEALPSEPFLEVLDDHGVEWEWDDYNMPARTPQGEITASGDVIGSGDTPTATPI
jgi:saccharopine dehydrogenase-like NADP-dependent oxidoreductase